MTQTQENQASRPQSGPHTRQGVASTWTGRAGFLGDRTMTQINNLRKMDFGCYLLGHRIGAPETGRGLIANPEHYGRNNFRLMAISLPDRNARRMAGELAQQ